LDIQEVFMTRQRSEQLLALVIFARSTSFLMVKHCLAALDIFNLLAVRFAVATVLLLLLFHKRVRAMTRATLGRGALLGLIFFAMMAGETIALSKTSSSTTALVESSAIMLIPLFTGLWRRRWPARANIAAAAVAFAGVACTIGQSGRFVVNSGIVWCLGTAVIYALSVIFTDVLSKQEDAITLGVLQVAFMALFSGLATFVFETPRLPPDPNIWLLVLYLSAVCSVFGFAIQPYAQSGTTSERASLFLAITPATATILGVLILREPLTWVGAAGCGLILLSFFIANQPPRFLRDTPQKTLRRR
jgi:drug/metabolite transporter (DMT)-like permease